MKGPEPDAAAAIRARAVLDRVLREGRVVAGGGASHAVFPVAIPRLESEALRRWVRAERATVTVEIGLGYGLSALSICEALLEVGGASARHVVIDPHQATRFENLALRLLTDAGCEHLVEHHAEPSQIVLPRFVAEQRCFDFAFVDGNHRFDGVFVDLVYLGRMLRPGGIIVCDDYQLPAVRRATAFFVRNLGWTVVEASGPDTAHEWAVLRTASEPDERPFDYFVDF